MVSSDLSHDPFTIDPAPGSFGNRTIVGSSSIHEFEDDDTSILPQNNRQTQRDTDNADDGAENLVRNEARAVHVLRGSVIALLVVAALLTGVFTHRLAKKNEIDSFTRDFEALAGQFLGKFRDGIGSYLYQSYTLSNTISGGLYAGEKPTFPEVTLENLDGFASSLRLQAQALEVIWSPLLKSRMERASWEKYATTAQYTLSSALSGQNPPCDLCGEGYEVANPDKVIDVPDFGSYPCLSLEKAGLSGYLNSNYCTAGKRFIPLNCGCKRKLNGTSATNETFWKISDGIFAIQNGTAVPDHGPVPFSPIWQISPSAGGKDVVMFNQMSDPSRREAIQEMIAHNLPVVSKSMDPTNNAFYQRLNSPAIHAGIVAVLFYPVYESAQSNKIVGSLGIDFSWRFLLEVGLPARSDGIVIVLENSCGQEYTFKVINSKVELLGEGDLHDTAFDALVEESSEYDFLHQLTSIAPRGGLENASSTWGCAYNIKIYPSSEMKQRYLTSKPLSETLVVMSIFVFTSSIFLLYDFILRRLQAKVMNSAKRSEAIVSSMFPAVVRDRLYGEKRSGQDSVQTSSKPLSHRKQTQLGHSLLKHKIRLKNFLAQPSNEDVIRESEPIADLFPNTTIMFADIAGFTAWSSEREPAQVFKLLETIYGAFDAVANKLGVFKIETIGDCYVAVTGLPEPCYDHAVVMVKFASECLMRMGELTKELEASLGPGTADLAIRVGLHSGPVTAGVLRGERVRFQLFGDTMNTASRMESNGKVNHIHVSKETAQLLVEAGKPDWVEQRGETVTVKGKGELQTYWVKPSKPKRRKASMSDCTSEDARSSSGHAGDNIWGNSSLDTALSITSSADRRDRLIAWNADLLEQFLQKIVARRQETVKCRSTRRLQRPNPDPNIHVVIEITEVISMPTFNEPTATGEIVADVGSRVRSQLRHFVAQVAALYHDNAFHNFEHASHVVMSASKLLKRIITPDGVDYRADESGKALKSNSDLSREIHESTYGISSDPLMQFAVVFSALVHDVGHTGLQNRQLVKKNDPLALTYLGKCVAEQHSVRCAWDKLMEDQYADLRQCIYHTDEDQSRFRQLVINAVIATDISDKELQLWRQNRWNKAFHKQSDVNSMDRKATLLFEYILQAADVAPTMQHWHIYQKWNQRLFEERYIAYVLGNDDDDPSRNWYNGELAFFDDYVTPLARNLEESNVFGVSCGDYLSYALENRCEWEIKGEQIVEDMVASHKSLIANLGTEHPLSGTM